MTIAATAVLIIITSRKSSMSEGIRQQALSPPNTVDKLATRLPLLRVEDIDDEEENEDAEGARALLLIWDTVPTFYDVAASMWMQ